MRTDWTKHLAKDPEAKERLENSITGSRAVLGRLYDILWEYEKSLDRSETDLKTYELPNWAERQAHKNGYRACLYRIQDLLNLDQEDK